MRYESEVMRLRREALAFSGMDTVAFVNATILTMEHGDVHSDVISGGTIILRDGLINAVGRDDEVSVPGDALVIQTDGGESRNLMGIMILKILFQDTSSRG